MCFIHHWRGHPKTVFLTRQGSAASERKLSILAQELRWGHMGLGHVYFTWGVVDLVKLGKNQRLQNLQTTMFLHKPSKHAPKGHIMRISPPLPKYRSQP